MGDIVNPDGYHNNIERLRQRGFQFCEDVLRSVAGSGDQLPGHTVLRTKCADQLTGQGFTLCGYADAGCCGIAEDEQAQGRTGAADTETLT